MNSLAAQKCIPCEIGTPPMKAEEAEKYLKQTPGWDMNDDRIVRKFTFKDFKQALKFVNTVGFIAEHEGHHPDILVEYNKVTITLMTHASKGLTENDFILAAKINEIQI